MARRAKTEPRVRSEHRWSRWRVGIVALIVLVIPIYLAFTKDIPFTHGYRLHAVFENSVGLRPGSPVRIAGVNVGRVKAVGRYEDSDLTEVTMEIDDAGLPIHDDATLKIRPRIFLEGNFFVDLRPGTPSSPELESGSTIGPSQTSTPVQLDELLTALQSDTRRDLQSLLYEYGKALNGKPTPEQDAELPPEVRGLTGAQALNNASVPGGDALEGATLVQSALLGSRPHDLSRTIAGIGQLSGALVRRERQLQDLITNFNLTAAAFANQSTALSSTIRLLGPTLATTRSALFTLDQALPSVRAFAREILPGVKETPATIRAAFPWLDQALPLLGPDELGALFAQLKPTVPDLGRLTASSIDLLPELDDFSACFSDVILPTGNVSLQDGALTTRRADGSVVESYKEFWYGLVGLASGGQSFDGNGAYLRGSAAGGEWQSSAGTSTYIPGGRAVKTLLGNSTERPLGTRPLYPRSALPINTGRACRSNAVPKLNGTQAGPGAAPPSVQVPTPPPFIPEVRTTPGTTTTGTTTTPATPARTAAAAAGSDVAAANDSVGARLLSRLNPLDAEDGR
jgi:phospholipid/cholesterol/gamma-HCH transport system substrate-binding protein